MTPIKRQQKEQSIRTTCLVEERPQQELNLNLYHLTKKIIKNQQQGNEKESSNNQKSNKTKQKQNKNKNKNNTNTHKKTITKLFIKPAKKQPNIKVFVINNVSAFRVFCDLRLNVMNYFLYKKRLTTFAYKTTYFSQKKITKHLASFLFEQFQ